VVATEAARNASGITMEALRNGSRKREISQLREELAILLTVEQGLSFAEALRQLVVTTSYVARTTDQGRELVQTVNNFPRSTESR